MKYPWMDVAERYLGVTEIPGPRHAQAIINWLERLRAWWRDDETPWCGVFVANCLAEIGIPVPKYWMRAREWLGYGQRLIRPVPGCIVVFSRNGGGHVGFVAGETPDGRLVVLGGNQGNKVCYAPFERSRILGYVLPDDFPAAASASLPVMKLAGESSSNEA